MKIKEIILTIVLAAQLTGCPGKDGMPFDWEGLILEKNTDWDSYKDTINGDYQFTYNTSGFVIGTEIEYKVSVKNNQVEVLPEFNGDKTMDDFFNEILGYIYDKECEIQVSFDETLPIIESYSATCGEETFGANLKDFQPVFSKY